MNAASLLAVEDLSIGFNTETGPVRVVENVSFAIAPGETVGLVGESGCGKSVTAQTIMRLLPSPPARNEGGRILFEGADLLRTDEAAMQRVRGDRIGMIFQEPMTSLNPTQRVERQIAEVLLLHRGMNASAAHPRVIDMLRQVGIGNPERRAGQYPHELSGGLRQRVMIAMAIICGPKLLIADEPTTALDVTIQAQIIALLRALQRDAGLSILLITHDLGVAAELCSRIVVMYAGRVAERGAAASVLGRLAASPRLARKGERLPAIKGLVPPPGQRGAGCPFTPRCPRALPKCAAVMPPLAPLGPSQDAACWNPVP
jgi:oligopeptide/dipeptide ABC transporter ATP-binding protein